jgi:hypothetical protein
MKGKERLTEGEFDRETFERLERAKKISLAKPHDTPPLLLPREEVYKRKYYVRKERSLRIVETYHADQEERGFADTSSKMTHLMDTVLVVALFSIVLFAILSMVGIDPLHSLLASTILLVFGESPFLLMFIYVNRGMFTGGCKTVGFVASVLFFECTKTVIEGTDFFYYACCRWFCFCKRRRKRDEKPYSQPVTVVGSEWEQMPFVEEGRVEEEEEEGEELEVIDAERFSMDLNRDSL